DALVRAPAVVFGPPGFIYRFVLGIVLFAAMSMTFVIACGLGAKPREEEELAEIEDDDAPFVEEDEGRGSISLGFIFHALMSAKARLVWFFGTAYRSLVASHPAPRAVSFARQEPNLGGRAAAPSISPEADEDFEDEEEEDDEEEAPAARAPRKKAAPR